MKKLKGLQSLMYLLSQAYREFGLMSSIKKIEVMVRKYLDAPGISVNDSLLNASINFKYLGVVISSSLFLDAEINSRIGKAATVISKMSKKVWNNNNNKLSLDTKLKMDQACLLSTIHYGSETWTTYTRQERRAKHLPHEMQNSEH